MASLTQFLQWLRRYMGYAYIYIYICGQDQSLGRMVITNPWAGHSSVWGRQSYMGGKGGDICEDEVYNDIPPPPPLQAWEHGLQ